MFAAAALPARAAGVGARDVPWISEVQRAPAKPFSADAGYMEPLFAGERPNRAEWERRRQEIRGRWLQFLGPMPARPAVKLTALSEDRPGGCVRRLVRYETEPGMPE